MSGVHRRHTGVARGVYPERSRRVIASAAKQSGGGAYVMLRSRLDGVRPKTTSADEASRASACKHPRRSREVGNQGRWGGADAQPAPDPDRGA